MTLLKRSGPDITFLVSTVQKLILRESKVKYMKNNSFDKDSRVAVKKLS
jgi:hypothetical protein